MTLTRGARGAKINTVEKAIQSAADGLGLSVSLRDARIQFARYISGRHIDTYNNLSDNELITIEGTTENKVYLARWLAQTYSHSQRLPGV